MNRRPFTTFSFCTCLFFLVNLSGCAAVKKQEAWKPESKVESEETAEPKIEKKSEYPEPKKEPKIKPGAIAVLGGTSREIDAQLAKIITERLKNSGGLTVVDQTTIKRTIPQYPSDIELIDFKVGEDKDKANSNWISPQSKATLDELQKKLNTEYLLILWSESTQTQETHGIIESAISFYSRLLRYPNSKIIGYTTPEQIESFLSLKKESKAIERFLSINADIIVKKSLEVIEGKR